MTNQSETNEPPFVKVEFPSSDGVEWLWAKPVEADGEVLFEVTNIPFTTQGVGLHDLVGWRRAEEEGDTYITFDGTVRRPSGYKTFGLTLEPDEHATIAFDEVRDAFRLEIEKSNDRSFAIASPPDIDLERLVRQLDGGVKRSLWTYERRS
jgi:hypothetical protein